jgi:hypothetical protein
MMGILSAFALLQVLRLADPCCRVLPIAALYSPRHAARLRLSIWRRGWVELLEPTARFIARQAARQIIICKCCRFGGIVPMI